MWTLIFIVCVCACVCVLPVWLSHRFFSYLPFIPFSLNAFSLTFPTTFSLSLSLFLGVDTEPITAARNWRVRTSFSLTWMMQSPIWTTTTSQRMEMQAPQMPVACNMDNAPFAPLRIISRHNWRIATEPTPTPPPHYHLPHLPAPLPPPPHPPAQWVQQLQRQENVSYRTAIWSMIWKYSIVSWAP